MHSASPDDETFLEGLDISAAGAVLLCTSKDDTNLSLALAIRDLYPTARLVISLSNVNLSHKIERELENCSVISPIEVAAPCFAASALHRGVIRAISHDGEPLALIQRGADIRSISILQLMEEARSESPALPECSAEDQPITLLRTTARHAVIDRYLFATLASIVLLFLGATTYFHYAMAMPWFSSLYFVVTTFCTVGYGDFSLRDSPDIVKLAGIFIMLASVTLTAGLFAILTNTLVQKRSDVLNGRRRYRMKDHVIICGLGHMALRMAECLRQMRINTLVIESDPDNPRLKELMALGIPYLISDATLERTLKDANLPAAHAVICAINDDLLNLQIGLAARALWPKVHLVLRVFDGTFAERVERYFHIHTALSASALSAPVFLAKALDSGALAILETKSGWWMLESRCDGTHSDQVDLPVSESLTLRQLAACVPGD